MPGKVLILMGSASDAETMRGAADVLESYGIPYEMTVASAHRAPERTRILARNAEKEGYCVVIAGAGAAAHLAGLVAAESVLPVIGVPLSGSALYGFDALLSTVQMPPGIPVATVALGKGGARNAAVLAAQILALKHPAVAASLKQYRETLTRKAEEQAKGFTL